MLFIGIPTRQAWSLRSSKHVPRTDGYPLPRDTQPSSGFVYTLTPKAACHQQRIAAGLVDGAEVPEDDAALLVSILSGAFSAEPAAAEAARASVQQRASRRDAYVI